MFCGKCGAKNDDSAKMCEKCGSVLEGDPSTSQENQPLTYGSARTRPPIIEEPQQSGLERKLTGYETVGGSSASKHIEAIAGNKTTIVAQPKEQRIRCQFKGCAQSVLEQETFICDECNKTMCQRHKDDDHPEYCKRCGEKVRAKEFETNVQRMGLAQPAGEIPAALTVITQPNPTFQGRIWTAQGTGRTTRDIMTVSRNSKGSYSVGDKFTLNVQAERDCHLTLVDIGTSGNVYVLLQNHRVRAGAPQALSGPDASHEWVISGPPGVERIKAFFTLEPLTLFSRAEDFSPVAPSGATRDIVCAIEIAGRTLEQMPSRLWTDAMCEFVVLGG